MPRSEIEARLTKAGIEQFLSQMARGAFEAEVESVPETPPEALPETLPEALLKGGDKVTVRLPALEFTGLGEMAQALLATKVPESVRPLIEKMPVFKKVGQGLDFVYAVLRNGLEFSSEITEWNSKEDSLIYVDEGRTLPRPLKTWSHRHQIADSKAETDEGASAGGLIIDEITVEVDPAIAAPLIEGALRLYLESRAKAYQRIFS